MTNKMTKREMFLQILSHTTDEAEQQFIQHEIDLLNAKTANRKPTATQTLNESYKALIVEFLEGGKSCTATEVLTSIPDLSSFQIPKVSALLRSLIEDGKVVRTVVKGKAMFSLA